jgi:hypothetical protein
MIANAQAGSGTIYPVNIHTVDGLLVQGDDPLTLPALKHEVQNYSLEGSNALTAYQATFQFLIDSSTVTTSYALNEIGLYCKLGTAGTPTLVYYAYVPGGGGDVVIPSGTSNATIDTNYLTITFSNDNVFRDVDRLFSGAARENAWIYGRVEPRSDPGRYCRSRRPVPIRRPI